MKRIATSVLASLLFCSACGSDKTTTPAPASTKPAAKAAESSVPAAPEHSKPAAESPKPPAEVPKPAEGPKPAASVDMDKAFKDLMAKPEQADESIVIQHILISFAGAPRMRGVTRTRDEAKVLAQKVFDEALAGGDFDALVKQYTNDSAPGTYPLTKAGRAGMVKGFGDVGFRLKVGEIGVSTWDAAASPFGWHIIKRLK
jgi:hypothetical protein